MESTVLYLLFPSPLSSCSAVVLCTSPPNKVALERLSWPVWWRGVKEREKERKTAHGSHSPLLCITIQIEPPFLILPPSNQRQRQFRSGKARTKEEGVEGRPLRTEQGCQVRKMWGFFFQLRDLPLKVRYISPPQFCRSFAGY